MLIHIFNFFLWRPADANPKQGRSMVLFLSWHIFTPVSTLVRELWPMFHVVRRCCELQSKVLAQPPQTARAGCPASAPNTWRETRAGSVTWSIPHPQAPLPACTLLWTKATHRSGASSLTRCTFHPNLYFWGGFCPVGRERMSRARGCLWRCFLSVWEGFGSIFPYVSYWDYTKEPCAWAE